jgi:hypothetical protein
LGKSSRFGVELFDSRLLKERIVVTDYFFLNDCFITRFAYEEFANCLDRDSLEALANLKLSPDAWESIDLLAKKQMKAHFIRRRAEYHGFMKGANFLRLRSFAHVAVLIYQSFVTSAELRPLVRERAQRRCDYCLLPVVMPDTLVFHLEHIIARQHRGKREAPNLAWSCHVATPHGFDN